VIHIHTTTLYRVYMIGFLPGFAYLGEVNASIAHARKEKPGAVAAGSVGIAGSQTGIYPLASPGGWNIIGRTPLQMFNALSKDPVLLKAGDEVEFYPAPGL
jgi:inhibitor of KinA